MKYYVYKLIDPRNKIAFYIGKGTNLRMYNHVKDVKAGRIPCKNPYLFNKIKQILDEGLSVIYSQVFFTDDEFQAYEKEIEVIGEIGLDNLCNLFPGGRGGNGKFSDPIERAKKISNALIGKKMSEAHYQACKSSGVWGKGEKSHSFGIKKSEEVKKILSQKKMGDLNPAKRPEVRKRISDTLKSNGRFRGERNSRAKLTFDTANEIRELYKTLPNTYLIAEKYNVSQRTIWKIVANVSYKQPLDI